MPGAGVAADYLCGTATAAACARKTHAAVTTSTPTSDCFFDTQVKRSEPGADSGTMPSLVSLVVALFTAVARASDVAPPRLFAARALSRCVCLPSKARPGTSVFTGSFFTDAAARPG